MNGLNETDAGEDTSPLMLADQLLAAHRAGELSFAILRLPEVAARQALSQKFQLEEISYDLIAAFKAKVDALVRCDAREAGLVANLAEALSKLSPEFSARGLGARTKGMALHIQSAYADAVVQYHAASRLYDKAQLPVEKARVERAMVDALIYLGKYDEALILANSARKVFLKHQETRLLAQLESNVGNIFHRLDRNREAMDSYMRAANYFTEVDDRFGLALTYFNRANVHCNLDEFREAHTLYSQSLALHEAEENETGALQARYSIGYLHFLRGAYHQAIRIMLETRTAALEIGDDHTAALCILDLAEIYLQLDALDEAEQFGVQARKQFQASGMRYEAARAATFVGIAQLRQGNFDQASVSFQQAHEEFEAEGNAVHLGLVQLYRAETALAQGEYAQAATLADAAAELFTEQQLRAKECMALLVKARAWLAEGQAIRYLCETIWSICQEIEMPWLRAQAAETLGDACLAENDKAAAKTYYSDVIASIEQIRSQMHVDEYGSSFIRNKFGVYEKLVRLCLEEQDSATAFYYLESSQARSLMDLLVNDLEISASAKASESGEQTTIERWHQLREELHWHHNKLRKTESFGKERLADADKRLRNEIRQCESAFDEITRTLQKADPEFLLQRSSGINASELRQILAADEAVIKYFSDHQQLSIFVIERSGLRVFQSPLTLTEIQEAMRGWETLLHKFHSSSASLGLDNEYSLDASMAHLHKLWIALFEPVASYLGGKNLIFVPNDILNNVPFQALYDGQRFLLDDHEITQVPSIRLLLQCASRDVQTKGSVAVFGLATQNTSNADSDIKAIRKVFPIADYFIGDQANSSAFENHAPGNGILHIGTQLVIRRDNPFFSTFLLADTAMNLYDLGKLKLPSALIALSGCKTSLSQIYAGHEIMGLAQAILNTGAGGLLVNLWPVNNEATAQLLPAFYQHIKAGTPLRKAIRLAALKTKEQHSHPYYWAPFTLISHQSAPPVILS